MAVAVIDLWVNKRAEHLFNVAYWSSRGSAWRKLGRQHRRRCAWCNPAGNQPPIAGKFAPGPKAAKIRRRR